MENEQDYIKKIEENTEENIAENMQEITYEDLVAMYYYEALSFQNPFYEKHLERVIEKLKPNLIICAKEYFIRNYSPNIDIATAEGALCSYVEEFYKYLNLENDPKKLCQRINAFIMYVHDRLRLTLGEEVFGFSFDSLKALNYIDITKPLNEQDKIIYDKMQEEDEKYEKNI
jgi:hypothetical protein